MCFAGDLALWHWSIRFTSVANSTLEANLASVFVVAFGWLAFGQRVSGRFGLGMLIALGGTVDTLVGMVFNYPTLSECYKDAAYDALARFVPAPSRRAQ